MTVCDEVARPGSCQDRAGGRGAGGSQVADTFFCALTAAHTFFPALPLCGKFTADAWLIGITQKRYGCLQLHDINHRALPTSALPALSGGSNMCLDFDLPAWVEAFGPTIGATIVGFWLWRHDRMRDQRERHSRALSFAISLIPVLKRAQYRASAQVDEQAAWDLFNEHDDDPNEAYKVLPGLPGLLREAHLLPPDTAKEVQTFWAKAQEHDSLVDRITRAQAAQSSDAIN